MKLTFYPLLSFAAALFYSVTVSADTTAPVITIAGESTVTVEAGNTYTDAGASASDNLGASRVYEITYSAATEGAASLSGRLYFSSQAVEDHLVNNSGLMGTDPLSGSILELVYDGQAYIFSAPRTALTKYDGLDLDSDLLPQIEDLNFFGLILGETTATGVEMNVLAIGSDADVQYTVTSILPVSAESSGLSEVTYSASDAAGNEATTVTRTVVVVDTTAPVITIAGNSTLTVEGGDTYTDAGASANDSLDGALSPSATGTVDTSVPGVYTVTYNVSDATGNQTTVTRTVTVVDTTAPVITIAGESTVTVEVGNTYTDAGASASDIVDGALSPSTTGTVDTSVPGVDTITYSVSDATGNESIAIRYVYVVSDDFVESIKANFGFIEQDSYDTLQDAYDQVVVERDARLTMEEVRDARVGSTIIAVENGQAVVRLQMEESSDLQVWEDTGDPATMTVPVPSDSDTKFIRFKMAE